jgi:flagellar biosynthesis protein FlhA
MEDKKPVKQGGATVAVMIVSLIMIMIIPLPPSLISFLIVINFTLSLLILMITLYIGNPLEFSVFPSVLLVMTLLDLALNISITRMILLSGNAGSVVSAFGEFVVGGNVVVGLVVFIIITIVQFVVITKGAERIAEVAARFTLDAMPGKQMSIDADLSAGLITNEEARRRRREVEDEADFYGAMDGASKFVKGNVIAAIIIIFINILGGMVMGYLRGGMSLLEITKIYTILTIGEGLVAQIPALVVSMAMGVIVTRAASKSDLGSDFTAQISMQPKAIKIVAGFLYVFAAAGLFTKLPVFPFLLMAILMHIVSSRLKTQPETSKGRDARDDKKKDGVPPLYNIIKVYPIELNIGYGLLSLIDENKKGNLLDRLKLVRENVSKELGFLLPLIRVKDNSELTTNQYAIKIKGNEVAQGEILIGHYLAMTSNNKETKVKINGLPTQEPTFGLPAIWIIEKERLKAETAGYTVVDSVSVLATHLTEVIKTYAHEVFTRKELTQMIDIIKADNPSLVEDLIPNTLSAGDVEAVIKNVLKEKIPVRDIETILEALANNGKKIKDTGVLTEIIREAISRSICSQFNNGKNHLTVVAMDPNLEKLITENVRQVDNDVVYSIEPSLMQKIVKSIGSAVEKLLAVSPMPLVVCSPNVRMHLKKLTERIIPNLNIISYNEIDPLYNVESVAIIGLPEGAVSDKNVMD